MKHIESVLFIFIVGHVIILAVATAVDENIDNIAIEKGASRVPANRN